MQKHLRSIGLSALTALVLMPACSKDGNGDVRQSETNFELNVAALNLVDVKGVVYEITVSNSATEVVWTRNNLDTTRFGDGVGSLSYVGPCDAQSNPHTIALSLLEMRSGPGEVIPTDSYINPAPAGDPVVITADCVENADTPVTINLTVMRNAEQGFFDVGVTFDDIFCSAKFDCLRDGQPMELLHNPLSEERDVTVVLGFSCTAGGDGAGGGEPTWMHLSNIVVQCEDLGGAPVTLLLDPSGPEGNNGGAAPLFYQTGIYRGQEALEPYDKCYWNMAFGVNLGATSGLRNCRFRAQGTASRESFGDDGATPPATVYPYVEWDVDLTDAAGALACNVHPLNGSGDEAGVATAYTDWSGTRFSNEWQCSDEALVKSAELACAGQTELGSSTSFVPQAGGLSVRFGSAGAPDPDATDALLTERYFPLPDGYAFGSTASCCVNPCCSL